MPRNLPWLNQKTKPAAKVNSTPKPAKRPRVQTSGLNEESPLSSASTSHSEKGRVDRLPSSSPILVPDLSPPSPEFMKDGVDADDAWVMVEDEFLETANLFTQHLHHAEYQRLKQLVKTQSESVTRKITRPVVSNAKVDRETAKRMEAEAKSSAQRELLQVIANSEEETPWMQDPRLAGLMNHPPVSSTLLASRTGVKSNTRAAAGFAKAHPSPPPRISHEKYMPTSSKLQLSGLAGLAREIERPDASDNDSEDLNNSSHFRAPLKKPRNMDRPQVQSFESISTPQHKPHRDRSPSPTSTSKRITAPRIPSAKAPSSLLTPKPRSGPSRTSAMDLLDEFDFPSRKTSSSGCEDRAAKQKAESAKKEPEQKRKSVLLEEIPTFLV
ncbi:hypothetical protein AOQ84DRAFT_360383 [Glonium stellatum]|uniref:Uncharacterized protein n=1 Tax=Glonium stellatum TaxID=574774 RepID=A0A8E2F8W2_9PEZI|nr:hypothetical protein AOQ84DRAFT_360383 [Glonium stellatum]